MKEDFVILKEKIADADMVLVGIGEEFGSTEKQICESGKYQAVFSRISAENEWMLPYIYSKIMALETEKAAYNHLSGLLKGKNYFIISLRADDMVYEEEFGFLQDRIVTPCGGIRKLQCEKNCEGRVYDVPAETAENLKQVLSGDFCTFRDGILSAPKCPNCGADLVFNKIGAEKYCEAGYLPMWEKYMKWLQGTLNHKICIIELGVGMKYPSVIRWPFEKTAFFNNKAFFFRIHKKLYHLTEELNAKGRAVAQNPIEFLTNSFE